MNARQIARLVVINVLILCGLLLLTELAMRVSYFVRSCGRAGCEYAAFHPINFLDNIQIGLSQYDPVLGYKPNPGAYYINRKGWVDDTVTILDDTSRSNGNSGASHTGFRILAVGDSFTFGAQVSDNETWPSALERLTGHGVVNGGVFGYGFGQSALRAKTFTERNDFDLVILSGLLPGDVRRDRMLIRSSMDRPAWIERDGAITISLPADHRELRDALIAKEVHLPQWVGYSYLLTKVNKKVFGYTGAYYIEHPEAASVEDITCGVTRELSRLAPRVAILVQYAIRDLKAPRPDLVSHLVSCAARYHVPVFDSYDYLRSRDNPDGLFYGHMTARGNAVLAEYIDGE